MPVLNTILSERLSAEDDPDFWAQLLSALADDASTLDDQAIYAEVGACSQWLRPHQRRWTKGGGFAAPYGYGKLPGFDWSVALLFDRITRGWVLPLKVPKKVIRVAAPTRTTRHLQAAVHTVWPPGTLKPAQETVVFYGFRKVESVWTLAACSRKV